MNAKTRAKFDPDTRTNFPICEVYAEFGAAIGKDDNGMSGPYFQTWDCIEEVHFVQCEMFGRTWTEAQLIEKFGQKGADALIELMQDAVSMDIADWDR